MLITITGRGWIDYISSNTCLHLLLNISLLLNILMLLVPLDFQEDAIAHEAGEEWQDSINRLPLMLHSPSKRLIVSCMNRGIRVFRERTCCADRV